MAVKLGNGQWAVKENNLLAYNDNSGQFFNKEFDFTRGSSATYVGKDGLIKTAGLQDTNLVQNGDFSQLGSELVTNGDFATDSDWTKASGWSISGGVANANTTAYRTLAQNIPITLGKKYKVVFDVVSITSGGVSMTLGADSGILRTSVGTYSEIIEYNNFYSSSGVRSGSQGFVGSIDNVSVKQVDPNDEWSLETGWSIEDGKVSQDGTGSGNNGDIYQDLSLDTNKRYKVVLEVTDYTQGTLYIDTNNIDLNINSVGTYTLYFTPLSSFLYIRTRYSGFIGSITNISVQEVQLNTPRIDFSDSADGALLLEPQSTNLIPYSEDFSQSSWNKNDMSIESGYLAPDGTNSAYKITKTGSNAHLVDTITGGNIGAKSIYAKTTSGTGTIILFNNVSTYFTITEDWQRFEIEQDGLDFFYAADFRDNSTLTEIIIWGAQSEALSYATSYIPTQGATSTRIAETCTNSGSAQDFNDSEGVLMAEISAFENTDTSNRFISILNGTNANNGFFLFYGGATNRIRFQYNTSTENFNFITTDFNSENNNKIAFKYKSNDISIWFNGIEVKTDTTISSTPVGLDNLSFNRSGSELFYGNTKNIQVFTTALSDEELEYITSYRSLNELVTTLKLNKL